MLHMCKWVQIHVLLHISLLNHHTSIGVGSFWTNPNAIELLGQGKNL